MRYIFILVGYVVFYAMGLLGLMLQILAPFLDLVADIAYGLETVGW